MQAEGMKNRTSLHSVYDYDLTIRVSLSIGTRGQYKMGTKGLLCNGMSTKVALSIWEPFLYHFIAPLSHRIFGDVEKCVYLHNN